MLERHCVRKTGQTDINAAAGFELTTRAKSAMHVGGGVLPDPNTVVSMPTNNPLDPGRPVVKDAGRF